jgi:basic membrane protein A
MNWKKLLAVMLLGVFTLGFVVGCGGSNSGEQNGEQSEQPAGEGGDEPLKVALLTEGAVNDGGWNASALRSLNAIEEQFGAEIAYTEKVERAQMEQVLRTYARQGFDVIFGHGFQFSEPIETVAKEFPETKFIAVNGYVSGDNYYSTNFKFGELGYFTGMTAGLMTKSNVVGMVAAVESPTVTADVDTFIQCAKEVNPDVEVLVSYVGSWEDIPKAKESAQAQLSKNADVILVMGNSFSIGVFQACEDAGAYSIGWVDDQSSMSDTVITCGLQDVGTVYLEMVRMAKEGTLESKVYNFGMNDNNAQSLSPFSDDVPQEVQDQVNQAVQDYLDGNLTLDLKY